jgi:hypothetical protein
MTKNSTLEKKKPSELPRYVGRARNTKGNAIEKQIIASSIFINNLRQFFIRGRTVVIIIAPQAAPAIKDATRIPIHENTYPYIDWKVKIIIRSNIIPAKPVVIMDKEMPPWKESMFFDRKKK